MTQARIMLLTTSILAMQIALVNAQALPSSAPKGQQQALVLSGHVVISGNPTAYLIRELPVSSFPALPDAVQNDLNKRGCAIPQTYEAHRPENVVHGNFEGRGASDWAVLCAAQGTVSLLVFFDGSTQPAAVLASAPETERLQEHDSSGVLGFNWAIDPASPQQIAEAQKGVVPHPPMLDHDAIADTIVEHKTIYHLYAKSAWTLVKLPD
jgi:hypothetical protein